MESPFNERQQALRLAARSFFEASCPIAAIRETGERSPGYSREVWEQMAQRGWLGLTYPQDLGGSGGGFLDLFALYEEMGRALVPSPHLSTVVQAGETILAAGSATQKRAAIPAIARGETTIAAAVMEPNGAYGPEGIEVAATSHHHQYHLKGAKVLVPHADAADRTLCVARTASGPNPAEGITLLLIERDTPGVAIEPLKAGAGLPLFTVTFDDARVPHSAVIGKANHGWEVFSQIAQRAAILQCAEIVGACQRVLEIATGHVKGGESAERSSGATQALQALCTAMTIDAAAASLMAAQAAQRLDQGAPHDREVMLARASASAAARRMALEAPATFASAGFHGDHDLQVYARRAAYWAIGLGEPTYQRQVIAQTIGL